MNLYINLFLNLVFLLSILGILHTYGFYPFLMSKLNLSGAEDRDVYTDEDDDDEWPMIHVVMAMYNEEAVIRQTLQSIVDSDYREGRFKVHIGSDDSTDDSHEIVESFQAEYSFIDLEVFEGRCGKIKIMNRLIEDIPEDDGSVLLLCDANVVWTETLAQQLARHFKDDSIGVVASNVIDRESSGAGISAAEEAYVNHENKVKHAEGILWGRMMGAFGACYALRRSLYEPVPEHFNVDDFYQTMACYEQESDGIVDLEAICYEAVSQDIDEEFRRKRRISKGNFQNLKRFATFLRPWNCGMPTFLTFWSHKGLRWFGPVLLGLAILSALILACQLRWFHVFVTLGFVATMLAAWMDKRMEDTGKSRIKVCKFIRYFYVMNIALFLGGVEYCRGVSDSVWEPTKRVSPKKIAANSGKHNL